MEIIKIIFSILIICGCITKSKGILSIKLGAFFSFIINKMAQRFHTFCMHLIKLVIRKFIFECWS